MGRIAKKMGILAACMAFSAVLFSPAIAGAAEYPKKNITLIVPYSAGGSSDIGARRHAQFLEKELGVSVIIDNTAGAGGWVGWNKLMKAKPDGYTIAQLNLVYVDGYLNPEMKRTQNLDSITPLARHVLDTTAWAVKPDSPYKDAKELLEYVKANPGKVKVATSGVMTQHHILLIQLEKLGYKMEPVHTNGLADVMTMVLGGHVDVASLGAGDVRKQARDGELRALAVMSPERSRFLPDTPTMKENTGLALEAYAARGYAGPAGMDPAVVKILSDALGKAMNNPEHIKEMENLGMDVAYLNSDDWKAFLKKIEKEHKEILGW
ncbi:putative Bug family protein [uncultured delta proteobacterium]|uniref:Putative Bug family protein n=1 Tax=uncultured delta proteobacterium TaxID=34034 RepID=A0A212JB38_9DELT|nr:putative Bug family protein [uncultured delta proteobacterium]